MRFTFNVRRPTALLLAGWLIACGDAKEPTEPTVVPEPTLSSIVDSVRIAWNLPAMGAAIVTLDNGVTAVAVAGTRRASGGAAVTTEDFWHLGSNTKATTSLLAAVAVSQARIQWTTTVSEAFPELTNIRAEYREVTLRDLLSHQSGFPRDAAGSVFASGPTAAVQRGAMVTWAVQQPPVSSKGTFFYSNVGYVIAAAMLERVFGVPYETAMATHIHTPLGMSNVGWGPQAAAGSTTQPVPHQWLSSGSWLVLEGFDNPPGFNSSGRSHMTLTSWGRFVQEVLRVEAGTSTVAPAAVARQTTSAMVTIGPGVTYGMGWVISTRPWLSGKVLFHDGSNGANHSIAYVVPSRNAAFLATSNAFVPGGRSTLALEGMIQRLVTFHDTGR